MDTFPHLGKVMHFPKSKIGRPASIGASWMDVTVSRAKELLGRLLNRLRIPGPVRNNTIEDALTGQRIEIHVGVFFTRISVNGRDYFFHRVSGKFDGTGMGHS